MSAEIFGGFDFSNQLVGSLSVAFDGPQIDRQYLVKVSEAMLVQFKSSKAFAAPIMGCVILHHESEISLW